MNSFSFRRFFSVFSVFLLIASGCGFAEDVKPAASPSPEVSASPKAPLKEALIFDFENEEGGLANKLGGDSGSWNLDPTDENNSYCDADIVAMKQMDGTDGHVLQLNYSVESEVPSQNGFWTKLKSFDASPFDHLEFDIKGDAAKGFTGKFKVEVKKFKDSAKVENIKGSQVVQVTPEWAEVSIPLNKMTGLVDFGDPAAWQNPAIARKDLEELVFVFQDRMASKKKGTVYIDNVRFVNNGNPGPTAVDFPPRKKEKTATRIEGVEFTNFLLSRLKGFPKQAVLKKEFPKDDKEFLKEIAKDTWRFFDEAVDKEHALPLDTIQISPTGAIDKDTIVGDYTNVTNIGVYFMVLVSAFDLGLISEEDAIARIKQTMTTMEKVEYHESGFPFNYYDTTTAERTSYFVSLVDSGWLVIGLYVAKNAFPDDADLVAQSERLIHRGNFSFFYDPVDRQMFHGYYQHLHTYSDYHYGVFYTEPRATSYMAIARGEAGEDHWFEGLIRTFPESFGWQSQKPIHRETRETLGHHYDGGYYEWKPATKSSDGSAANSGGDLIKYVPSWGGSMFEALMPTLVLKEKELAPHGLGGNDLSHVQAQIRYATEELKYPVWGMSPSSTPEGGYSEYGVKPLGSKGYKPRVVTPHATALALEFAPKEAIANFHKMIELYNVYGEYGFYDAVTIEADPKKENSKAGLVAQKYLALDQGMLFVAINNYLNDGAIRKRFHAEPIMQKAEKLLTEEHFFKVQEAAAPAEAAPASPETAAAKP